MKAVKKSKDKFEYSLDSLNGYYDYLVEKIKAVEAKLKRIRA
jgi:hypothetical protein